MRKTQTSHTKGCEITTRWNVFHHITALDRKTSNTAKPHARPPEGPTSAKQPTPHSTCCNIIIISTFTHLALVKVQPYLATTLSVIQYPLCPGMENFANQVVLKWSLR